MRILRSRRLAAKSAPPAAGQGPWPSGAGRVARTLAATILAGLVGTCLSPGLAEAQITATQGTYKPGSKPLFTVKLPQPFPDARATFDEVRRLILAHYYSDTIDEEALYHAAVRGMLRHISPPDDPERAILWAPATYEKVANRLRGKRVSLGIRSSFNQADGALTVTGVQPGSPADGKLQTSDRIMRVDGRPLLGRDVASIQNSLQGEPGETVNLTVVRDISVLQLAIELASFEVPAHQAELTDEGAAYLKVSRMTAGLGEDLAVSLDELIASGARAAILDLRGNAGGVFAEGLKVAELFSPQGTTLLHSMRRGAQLSAFRSGNQTPFEGPLAVLVDAKTASAAELVAAAVVARPQTAIIGSPTFGKGILEQTFELENGYRLKFIVGALYDPMGKPWQSKGIRPQLLIPGPSDAKGTEKAQSARRAGRTTSQAAGDAAMQAARHFVRTALAGAESAETSAGPPRSMQ